jgi:hypothetical protein
MLDAEEFVYVIASDFFPPLPADRDAHWPQVKWSEIRISSAVKPSENMTQQAADEIGHRILDRARLIPIAVDFSKTVSSR